MRSYPTFMEWEFLCQGGPTPSGPTESDDVGPTCNKFYPTSMEMKFFRQERPTHSSPIGSDEKGPTYNRFGLSVGLKTGPYTAIPARKLRLVYFLYTDERVSRRSYFLNFFFYFRGFDQEVFKITRLLQFLTLIIVKLKFADRPLYASGHRRSYGPASFDRLGSFRENMENPLLSSLPNMTRSSSNATQGDVVNYFQCVRFDPKSMVVEHKLNRAVEFKRLASAAVGIPMEDSLPASSKSKSLPPPSLEDLRRLKSGVRECSTKARERVKILNDCLSVINKCFPTIPSRKRSRLDTLSSDRSNILLPIDRPVSVGSIGTMGSQGYDIMSGFALEHKKLEERTKNTIPNKRTRTSMLDGRMDVRVNTLARPSGTVDKDGEVSALSKSSETQGEERALSIVVDNWEKSKMKKKRSGIKSDAVSSSTVRKPVDGFRESNPGTQPRLPSEARSRLSCSHGSRIMNGGMPLGKAEPSSRDTSLGMHSSVSRAGPDNNPLVHDRRERLSGAEKERVNVKAVNKANACEDFSSGIPTLGTKLNTNARAPRSGLVGGISKLSQVVQRSTASNDWELSNCTNKLAVTGANNRKCSPSTQSASPPVANWVQRPQKISRTARRTSLLPIVPVNDETAAMDTTSNMIGSERCLPGNSFRQIKKKNLSPVALSENELRDENKKCDEMDGKSFQNVQKISTLPLPPRKSKVMSVEDHGDGARRQGRSARGFTSTRSLMPLTVEKSGNAGTTKQIRTSRLVFDKIESRAGRPPTRKLSDKKAHARQRHTKINTAADFLDNVPEELLAAANAVTDTAQALSSPLWKKMEPVFRFISDADFAYLRDQINLGSAVEMSAPMLLDADSSTLISNGCALKVTGRDETVTRSVEPSPEHLGPGARTPQEISLYQRIVSALIPEEGNDIVFIPDTGTCYDHLQNGLLPDQMMPDIACSEHEYNSMPINDRLLMEIQSIGIYPDLAIDLSQTRDEEINGDIIRLNEKYQKQVCRKKNLHGKLLSSASKARELHAREFERHALDKLVGMAYEKYMSCRGPHAYGMKSASSKMAKQATLAFVKWTLERYQEFDVTRKSCFGEHLYREMFLSGVSRLVDGQTVSSNTDNESSKLHISSTRCSVDITTSDHLGTLQSPSNYQEMYSNVLISGRGSEQTIGREDTWSNRVKKRGLLLDDVGGGTMSTSLGVPAGLGSSLSSSAKGKRSERDREGKGNIREALSRSGATKLGRPASAHVKGERRSKAKPKQKTTQLSASVNGPLGKMLEEPKVVLSSMPKSSEMSENVFGKDKNDHDVDELEETIDFSVLADVFGGQGEDLELLLNMEDDGLQDNDIMDGLHIPMDNLQDFIERF
ncbi:hypothetical protein Adt_06633 [Abeliophyllum distichum]|uniref:Uncharacterized protein n=1 Tax=Abeliophyllum distichum TaxID=126358 RepID=A0ABD1V7I8_9LAMI